MYWLWFAFEFAGIYSGRGNETTIPNLSRSALASLPLPMPPVREQRGIATVLNRVRCAIAQQERIGAITGELGEVLLHRLFSEGTRGEPKKITAIGSVPQSWRIGKLEDLCVLQRGFDITKKEQRQGMVPVVSSGGISSYHDTAMVKGPGVVIGRKGTLGKVHHLEQDFWPHDTTLWVKDFKGNDPAYVSYYLKRMRLERFNSGVSNPTLNRNTIHGEPVAIPSTSEQAVIGQTLLAVDRKKGITDEKRKLLESLFGSILHRLMTAQIRVHDLELSALEATLAE